MKPLMDKDDWLGFISNTLRSQISLENAHKAQTWALAFAGLLALGFALNAVSISERQLSLYPTKILFLALYHLVLALGFYLPGLLQKGQKPVSEWLGIRDFTGLIVTSMILCFYSIVVLMLNTQLTGGIEETGISPFAGFVVWVNFLTAVFYLGTFAFYFLSLAFFPQVFAKIFEAGTKIVYSCLGLHAVLFLLLGFGYSETTPLGSPAFFEHFRVAGLFWIFILASIRWIGKLLSQSPVPALARLELEVAFGRLDKTDAILGRFKDIAVSPRLDFWIRKISHAAAEKAHSIAGCTHEALELVNRQKPSEVDLRQVEDRYRKAEGLYRRLEKENTRFLLCLSLFDLNETEREKAEWLRDQFSRELRNSKIELASVRKRIDERLVGIKTERQLPQSEIVRQIPSVSSVSSEASNEKEEIRTGQN